MTEAQAPTVRRSRVGEAVRMVGSSARVVVRQARGRITVDLVTWPYREGFSEVWRTVDWIPGWFHEGSAGVLYGVMREQQPTTVVEIGSYLGRSTVFFALILRQLGIPGQVVAVDPHTGDRQQLEGLSADRLPSFELFQQHCRAAGVEDLVNPRVATSVVAAARWAGPIDVLFVDGWHSYDAVISDGEAWLPHLSPDGVVVFDDYIAYAEVGQAVRDLAAAGRFHLWGSVFGQAIGGVAAEPGPAVRRALTLSGQGMTSWVRNWLSQRSAKGTGCDLRC